MRTDIRKKLTSKKPFRVNDQKYAPASYDLFNVSSRAAFKMQSFGAFYILPNTNSHFGIQNEREMHPLKPKLAYWRLFLQLETYVLKRGIRFFI